MKRSGSDPEPFLFLTALWGSWTIFAANFTSAPKSGQAIGSSSTLDSDLRAGFDFRLDV
jgi:hypothetical protein